MAARYLDLRLEAISSRFGSPFQQVFTEQEPETPWHLHLVSRESLTTCRAQENRGICFCFLLVPTLGMDLQEHSWEVSGDERAQLLTATFK